MAAGSAPAARTLFRVRQTRWPEAEVRRTPKGDWRLTEAARPTAGEHRRVEEQPGPGWQAVERHRGRVELAFSGYSNDPRELYDIPEVRNFCAELDDAFPYWFYFVSTESVTLGVIACCLCSVTEFRPGEVSVGPDLLQFMTRHFDALNWLFENYSLDERHNVEISGRIVEYFTKRLRQFD